MAIDLSLSSTTTIFTMIVINIIIIIVFHAHHSKISSTYKYSVQNTLQKKKRRENIRGSESVNIPSVHNNNINNNHIYVKHYTTHIYIYLLLLLLFLLLILCYHHFDTLHKRIDSCMKLKWNILVYFEKCIYTITPDQFDRICTH